MASLNQINNKSLRERILTALRDAILSGEFKPGQTLIETELASQLGVSRAPLREALQILNSEGLVETVPYRGTTVRRLTQKDIEEIYSLRSVLESFAVRRLIAQNEAETIVPLRELYVAMLAAADENDIRRVNMIDRDFHDTLIDLSEHSMLQASWNMVAVRIRQVMALRNMSNNDLRQVALNHLPLLEALEQGDAEKAVAIIEKHVASAGDLVIQDWVTREQDSDE